MGSSTARLMICGVTPIMNPRPDGGVICTGSNPASASHMNRGSTSPSCATGCVGTRLLAAGRMATTCCSLYYCEGQPDERCMKQDGEPKCRLTFKTWALDVIHCSWSPDCAGACSSFRALNCTCGVRRRVHHIRAATGGAHALCIDCLHTTSSFARTSPSQTACVILMSCASVQHRQTAVGSTFFLRSHTPEEALQGRCDMRSSACHLLVKNVSLSVMRKYGVCVGQGDTSWHIRAGIPLHMWVYLAVPSAAPAQQQCAQGGPACLKDAVYCHSEKQVVVGR
jgi:hypothetical protein